MNRMDTNGAFQLATQFLAAASMDVAALNSNCNVHVDAFTPEGENGQNFVPVYYVYWVEKGKEGRGSAASIQFCQPTKAILQMRVNKYIHRKPLEVSNLDYLLSQTNDLPGQKVPGKR
jgi:hypothetical protein